MRLIHENENYQKKIKKYTKSFHRDIKVTFIILLELNSCKFVLMMTSYIQHIVTVYDTYLQNLTALQGLQNIFTSPPWPQSLTVEWPSFLSAYTRILHIQSSEHIL